MYLCTNSMWGHQQCWQRWGYWKLAPGYYKLDWVSKGMSSEFLTMAKLAETGSTKSPTISSQIMSLKMSIQKTTKAIAWLFKKVKWSLSTCSVTHSTASCSSAALPPFNNEAGDLKSTNDSSTKPEVELMPEHELCLSLYFISDVILMNTL